MASGLLFVVDGGRHCFGETIDLGNCQSRLFTQDRERRSNEWCGRACDLGESKQTRIWMCMNIRPENQWLGPSGEISLIQYKHTGLLVESRCPSRREGLVSTGHSFLIDRLTPLTGLQGL